MIEDDHEEYYEEQTDAQEQRENMEARLKENKRKKKPIYRMHGVM